MQKVNLPKISERIRGFTLPENGVFYVFDYDEVFRISLGATANVEITGENPYDFEERCGSYYGVSDKEPILSCRDANLRYSFDPSKNSQTVHIHTGHGEEILNFPSLSGDWFVATLTADGTYLFIAEPYLIEAYAFK